MKRVKQLLIICTVLTLLQGCSLIRADSGLTGPSAESTDGGLRLELWCDKPSYRTGEVIKATLRVTNVGNAPEEITAHSTSFGKEGSLSVSAVLDDGSTMLVLDESCLQKALLPGDDAILYDELLPGESIITTACFLAKYNRSNEELPAWDGNHRLQASIRRGEKEEGTIYSDISLSFEIYGGAQRTITPEAAAETAMRDAAFVVWYELHTGDNIAREENGAYYMHDGQSWTACDKETYDRLRENPEITTSVIYEDGIYTVTSSSKLGSGEVSATARIDAKLGRMIR